ncbi:MAG: GNAT family N-acetyltransferase [Crocinitomicaceae bacterium]|nr:GNAT family N-acetyltransferase [Crocinitomicaceae bacterium]
MKFKLKPINSKELNIVLDLFKSAALSISKKNIDHWQYWKNPPIEKLNWVKEGLHNKEFYFIESHKAERIGMVRILKKDLLYWGEKKDNALYIHSLIVKEKFSGLGIGKQVINTIEKESINHDYLRLDCDAKNSKLCNYYINQGFVKVGKKTLPLSTYNLYEKKITRK